MKIVADTNILISALGWIDGNEYKLIRKCMLGEATLVISLDLLKEFIAVASRPKFGFSRGEIDEFVEALLAVCVLVQPEEKVDVVKEDSADNRVLECALEALANYIVTGDKHLLDLKLYRGVKILRTWEALDLLKKE